MSAEILVSPCAETRLASAAAWLRSRDTRAERRVTVAGASIEAAAEVARRALASSGVTASFGWQRTTLGILAAGIARPELARRGLVPASQLALEAVSARVVHHLHRGGAHGGSNLGRFAPIGDLPGLPRAVARTVSELRLAGEPALADADLARLVKAFEDELEAAGLADRARTLAIATELAARMDRADLGALLLLDVPLRTGADRQFVAALAARASATFATFPAGDDRAIAIAEGALGRGKSGRAKIERRAPDVTTAGQALARLQAGLFGDVTSAPSEPGRAPASIADGAPVAIISAPGESRECVEIARLVLAEAERGTRLDRIAVLLRSPHYTAHLEEALRRARLPAYFALGTRKPDASGRAMLALLACAAEGLSARRFAEYLSLGQAPDEDADDATIDERAGLEDERDEREDAEARARGAEEDRAAPSGTLRAPRHWERLLVDAAVIGGEPRWHKRLEGLQAKLTDDLASYEEKEEEALACGVRRDLTALEALRKFALPIIGDLAALQASAPWGEWLDGLTRLAARAIRHPERVLAVLSELRPMARVSPVDATDVRLVLEGRLSHLTVPASGRRYGRVYVATIEQVRGLAFDVVFVPGLAEKIFPQRVVEDPLLLDDARRLVGGELPTNDERTADERLALRLAVGAASRRIVLSYPRVDVEQARPRTPSFYGLEVLRVAEGELCDFHHLAESAAKSVGARMGWPAPADRRDAIDEAEYDLALLESVLGKNEDAAIGEAHYLLSSNEHLARALRFRGRRWLKAWKAADGLVNPPEEALVAIREHALDKRSYSPTALQNFAACPYRFFLSAVHRLAPREEPAAIEDLDPMTRGSLVHEVQFVLLSKLRAAGLLPVTTARLDAAREMLDAVLQEVGDDEHERLHPAIERVWKDTMDGIAADLREWLRRMPEDSGWTPAYFELSFGLTDRRDQDAVSRDAPVLLDAGIRLRGSIDLVETDAAGRLRATDYKTGKVRASKGDVIAGGEILQPVLYALTVEKLFPGREVKEGRLYYCTAAGDFAHVDVPLDDAARAAARRVAKTVGEAVSSGFLPAAPAKDACRYCDFRDVCGPYEEIRTKRKSKDRLRDLHELRRQK